MDNVQHKKKNQSRITKHKKSDSDTRSKLNTNNCLVHYTGNSSKKEQDNSQSIYGKKHHCSIDERNQLMNLLQNMSQKEKNESKLQKYIKKHRHKSEMKVNMNPSISKRKEKIRGTQYTPSYPLNDDESNTDEEEEKYIPKNELVLEKMKKAKEIKHRHHKTEKHKRKTVRSSSSENSRSSSSSFNSSCRRPLHRHNDTCSVSSSSYTSDSEEQEGQKRHNVMTNKNIKKYHYKLLKHYFIRHMEKSLCQRPLSSTSRFTLSQCSSSSSQSSATSDNEVASKRLDKPHFDQHHHHHHHCKDDTISSRRKDHRHHTHGKKVHHHIENNNNQLVQCRQSKKFKNEKLPHQCISKDEKRRHRDGRLYNNNNQQRLSSNSNFNSTSRSTSFSNSNSISSSDRHQQRETINVTSLLNTIQKSPPVVVESHQCYNPMITFCINYRKLKGFDYNVYLCGDIPELGGSTDPKRVMTTGIPLELDPEGREWKDFWQSEPVEIKSKEPGTIVNYRYYVLRYPNTDNSISFHRYGKGYDGHLRKPILHEIENVVGTVEKRKGPRFFYVPVPNINNVGSEDQKLRRCYFTQIDYTFGNLSKPGRMKLTDIDNSCSSGDDDSFEI